MTRSIPVRLVDVCKSYHGVAALRNLDLEVPFGRLLALLGPNGAGKSTTIELICGLRRPDSGQVELFGKDPRMPATRRWLGVTPQSTGFPGALRIWELVEFARAHYPEPKSTDELLDGFGLSELASRQVGGLSGGQKRRLAVALAFAGNPSVVVLDEPTTGMDIDARRELWTMVRTEVDRGVTVVLTTHYLEEAEALADDVVLLHRGRVRARGSVAELVRSVALTQVSARFSELPAELPGVVSRGTSADGSVTLFTADAEELLRSLVLARSRFSELRVRPASLEEAFRQLIDDETVRETGAAS